MCCMSRSINVWVSFYICVFALIMCENEFEVVPILYVCVYIVHYSGFFCACVCWHIAPAHVLVWASMHLEAMSAPPNPSLDIQSIFSVCSGGRPRVRPKEPPLSSRGKLSPVKGHRSSSLPSVQSLLKDNDMNIIAGVDDKATID